MTHASRNTTTGLIFEKETPINKIFSNLKEDSTIYFAANGKDAIRTGMENWLKFVNTLPNIPLVKDGAGHKHPSFWGKNHIPDGAILYHDKLLIIEKKSQEVNGSADEKIGVGDFKLSRFEMLLPYINQIREVNEIYYVYLLKKDWYDFPKYWEVMNYVRSKDSRVIYLFTGDTLQLGD